MRHGQRPRVQLGHHVTVLEFALRRLDPALAPAFDLLDRMRRKRNLSFGGIAGISEVEAEEAVKTAEFFLPLVTADIHRRIR